MKRPDSSRLSLGLTDICGNPEGRGRAGRAAGPARGTRIARGHAGVFRCGEGAGKGECAAGRATELEGLSVPGPGHGRDAALAQARWEARWEAGGNTVGMEPSAKAEGKPAGECAGGGTGGMQPSRKREGKPAGEGAGTRAGCSPRASARGSPGRAPEERRPRAEGGHEVLLRTGWRLPGLQRIIFCRRRICWTSSSLASVTSLVS